MPGRPIRLAAAFAAAASLSFAAPAVAQPSLNSEHMRIFDVRNGGPDPEPGVRITDIDCQNYGGETVGHYRAEGPASGPYPGTFVETGTFTIEYSALVGGPGDLKAFDASFQITSGDTTVSGTRTLIDGMQGEQGACHTGLDYYGESPRHGGQILGNAAYDATIKTPTGEFTDRGTGGVLVTDRGNIGDWTDAWPRIREFSGSFVNPQPDAVPVPVVVEPDPEPTGPPPSTVGCKVTYGGWYGDGRKTTLAGQARGLAADTAAGSTTFQDHAGTALKSETVVATVCDGARAEVHGTGEVAGKPVEYRIDMVDGGKMDKYRIRWTGSSTFDSGEQTLAGGNITVH